MNYIAPYWPMRVFIICYTKASCACEDITRQPHLGKHASRMGICAHNRQALASPCKHMRHGRRIASICSHNEQRRASGCQRRELMLVEHPAAGEQHHAAPATCQHLPRRTSCCVEQRL